MTGGSNSPHSKLGHYEFEVSLAFLSWPPLRDLIYASRRANGHVTGRNRGRVSFRGWLLRDNLYTGRHAHALST